MAEKSSKTMTSVGLAALAAAAAAGAYYFYGSKDAKKHRAKLKSWVVKAKGEVMERLENMKEVTRETYDKVIDEVLERYKDVKNVPASEILALGRELRGHWKNIAGSIQSKRTPRRATTRRASPKR